MGFLVVYLIGYILSFLIGRFTVRYIKGDYYCWSDIILILIISFLSYISFFAFLFLYIIIRIDYMFNDKKPPRWL